jgi:hypothetical protein
MLTKPRVIHALTALMLAVLPAFASAHERSAPRTYRPAGSEERCHEATREAPRTYRPQRFAPAGDRRAYRPRSGRTYRPQGNEAYRPRHR